MRTLPLIALLAALAATAPAYAITDAEIIAADTANLSTTAALGTSTPVVLGSYYPPPPPPPPPPGTVPEPGSLALLAAGLLGAGAFLRLRRS